MKKKELQMLLIVLGILILFASYWFAFRNFEEKAEQLEAQNVELQATVDKLEVLKAKQPEYLESIDQMKAADTQIINAFASGVQREDQIMYLYNMELVDANEVKVPSVSMTAEQPVPYAGSTTTDDGYELVDDGITMYKLESTVSLITTNNGLKNVLDYIYDMDTRKAIYNVSLSVSNDGYLTGNMMLNFYYLNGTEKPYVNPDIQGVPTGTVNFFGAVEGAAYNGSRTEQEAEDGSEEGGETAETEDGGAAQTESEDGGAAQTDTAQTEAEDGGAAPDAAQTDAAESAAAGQ